MAYEQSFAALAHPLRQEILRSLGSAPRTVRELTDLYAATQPAISQHLKVLKDAGLVSVTPKGAKNYYVARPESLEELKHFLEQNWLSVLKNLDDDEGTA